MCRRVDCQTCGRPTYAGCGRHIEEVLGDVAPDARCSCREEKAVRGGDHVESSAPLAWLKRLIGT